jgi:CRP-like cAMP-binding protein
MSQVQQSAVRNRLLAALPPADFAALTDHLQPVELKLKQVLYEPGQKIQTIHFPEGGMVSHVIPLENGHGVEVGLVGREGLVGLSALLGAERAVTEAMVQMEGPAWRIRANELRAAFERSARSGRRCCATRKRSTPRWRRRRPATPGTRWTCGSPAGC